MRRGVSWIMRSYDGLCAACMRFPRGQAPSHGA